MQKINSLQSLQSLKNPEPQLVKIQETDLEVYVRQLSVNELDEFTKSAGSKDRNKAIALVVARGLVDESGNRLVEDADVEKELFDLPAGSLGHLFNAVLKISCPTSIEDAEKN